MNLKLFKRISFIQFLYALPLILSSSLYIDDIFRATSGWMGYWLYDARPLTFLLMKFLNIGEVISDISPLPLLISILSLSIASAILAKQITDNEDWITAIAASSLGMCPLYIENLSYAFDGMTMSISILIAIFSATLSFRYSFAIKSIAVLSILSIYQPTISAYISTSAFIAILYISKNSELKHVIKKLASDILGLVIGYALYKPVISWLYPQSEYFFGKGSIATNDIMNKVTSNVMLSTEVLSSTGAYFWVAIISFILSVSVVVFRLSKGMQLNHIALALISFSALIVSILGPVSLTNTPYFAPRIFIGCSVFIFVSSIILSTVKHVKYIVAIPAFLSFIIIYTYSGAIKGEAKRNDAIANEIQTVMTISDNDISLISVSGSPGYSSVAEQAAKKIKLIDYIVPRYFDSARLTSAWLSLHGVNVKVIDSPPMNTEKYHNSLFFYYSINGKTLNIQFKNPR